MGELWVVMSQLSGTYFPFSSFLHSLPSRMFVFHSFHLTVVPYVLKPDLYGASITILCPFIF